jgi:hypothetical protein
MRSRNVTLYGVESVLSGLQENDYTMIADIKWYVVGRIPDGTGFEQVVLSKQAVRPE